MKVAEDKGSCWNNDACVIDAQTTLLYCPQGHGQIQLKMPLKTPTRK